MLALLKNGETVVVGDDDAIYETKRKVCPAKPFTAEEMHQARTFTMAWTDANEEPEVLLYEQWEDRASNVWHIAYGLKGIAAALTS